MWNKKVMDLQAQILDLQLKRRAALFTALSTLYTRYSLHSLERNNWLIYRLFVRIR